MQKKACLCCPLLTTKSLNTHNTHSWRRMESLWSGWTPPRTAQPCWAGSSSCLGGKTAVSLHTHPHRLHCLPQPFALWSWGLDFSPGGAAPRPGGDTPVGVLFLSRWPPGLCRHGRRIGSHVASEPHVDKRHFHDLLEMNMSWASEK